jgi:hypothetical protein
VRVLPDVVGTRALGQGRGLLVAAVAVVAVSVLAGCSQFDSALGQRQAIVTFRSGTPVAQRLAVRAACAKTPAVTAQPLPPDVNSPYALEQVTYQINKASDADVAMLEECLSKYPSVSGVSLQDSSDQGN